MNPTALLLLLLILTHQQKATGRKTRLDIQNYGAKRLMAEFTRRNWSLAAVKRLLQKIDATGSADRKTGSGNVIYKFIFQ